MKNIKKKIRKKAYKIVRHLMIKERTNFLGRIEEHDDKIICHVNNKKLKKYKSSSYYKLYFMHILDKETAKIHKLNKPIYYIIEDMTFDERLEFTSVPNTYIKFKNCKFNDCISIERADNVIFEKNKYFNKYYVYLFNKYFLEGKVQSLEFINEDFIDCEENKKSSCFGINVEANNIKIFDSQIKANEQNGMIIFKVKENLTVEDSEVFAPIIEIDSKNIETEDSNLIASEIISIQNENNNEIKNIQSKEIIYNGLSINSENITHENIELQNARQELISKLRELRNRCTNTNNSILNKASNTLNEKSVSKVLKG